MTIDFTHRTKIVSMKNGVFNLEEAVKSLLAEGLQPGAKNITIFVFFDGFKLWGATVSKQYVYIGDQLYPLVILPTDNNIIYCTGDVQLRYNT